MAFFFHLEQYVRACDVGLNLRSVIEVVKFITVFTGLEKSSMLKMLTVPILDPVARCFSS